MLTYFGNDLIKDTKNNDKKLIFVDNLRMFVENNKDEIKFVEVNAKQGDDQDIVYLKALAEDGTEYAANEDIQTKEEFETWYELFSSNKKTWSMRYMEGNLPKLSYRHMKEFFKKQYNINLGTTRYELCHDDEDLFKGLSSSYFCGYSFNEADPNVIYEDVYIYDFKSFLSSIMSYNEFPKNFNRISNDNFKKVYISGQHFYGEFLIKIKNDNSYFHQFGELYNEDTNTFHGYFNDVDFEFINLLGDIKDVKCYKLWTVELSLLPENLRTSIEILFSWKEREEDEYIKKIYKLTLEKIYGECVRRRFYKTKYKWSVETNSLEKIHNEYDWKELKKTLKDRLDYSWGVWIDSYARLKLLKLRLAMGKDALYGDIDSIFFINKDNLKYVEEINKNGNLLGSLAKEGFAHKIKFLDKKWYCWEGTGKKDEPTFVVKCSGANPQIVKEYLLSQENSVEAFSKSFPMGVNPYKRVRKNSNGKLEYYWAGGSIEDRTSTDDKKIIISCAGSGKTTTLIENVREKFKTTEDRITVIAFTNKNVDELRQRIGITSERLEIRTLDSLASSLLYGAIKGDLFEAKLTVATEFLLAHPDVMPPSHLFVDEFQDLDLVKLNFINAIPCISRFYIGDPNQSIYGYSGAENLFNRLLGFVVENRFINYRCPQNINDYGEGFLNEKNRPRAVSYLKGRGELMWSVEIPDDGSYILCRTNEQVDKISEKYPNREVMTIHKSKGLTFDKVSIVGLDKTMDNEEEQNIAYVACTRATQKLTMILGGVLV